MTACRCAASTESVEVFHEGRWREAAQVSFSDVVLNGFRANDCVFEYDLDYAFGATPLARTIRR